MAKERGIFTKQFEETPTTKVILDWGKVPGPTDEERLSQLCRQVLEAEKFSLHYGINLPGLSVPPDHGPAHCKKSLKLLALFQP